MSYISGSGGGSGSAGNPSSAGMIDVTAAPYNVKADGYIFADGTTTNGQPTFSSASQSCTPADIGKLAIVVNPTTGVYPFGTGLITVTACNGAAWTLSGNASQSIVGTANWAMGSDATPGGTGGLVAAWTSYINATAPGAGRILALPCGVMILTAPPFQAPGPNNTFNIRPDVTGCGSTGGTTFVFHPNVVSGLPNGGNIFWKYSLSPIAGALAYAGLGGNARLKDIVLTSITGNLPGVSGKTYSIYDGNGYVDNLSIFGFGLASGAIGSLLNSSSGETRFSHLNIQSIGVGSAGQQFYTIVSLSGQGTNSVDSSVFQSAGVFPAIACGANTNCFVSGIYCAGCSSGVVATASGALITVVGSTLNCGNGPAIGDGGNSNTFYIFGNPLIQATTASRGALIVTNASSIADVSGSKFNTTTAGWNITGAGTVNDRAGNTFSSALTQFTGQYVPIGGGSVATNKASAATNFGTNLGSTNIVTTSPGTATYDVKIGFRQVTAGVGCSAASNTVTGVLSWTAGGQTQSTGANGVPALGTLTISANGAVGSPGSTNAYVSQPVHADINTAITFTTTSVLNSTGCTTTPQYVVDFSNI